MKENRIIKAIADYFDELLEEISLLRCLRGGRRCELLGICRTRESGWKCLHGCMILNAERARKYEGLPKGCWDCRYLEKCRAPKEEGWKCHDGCRKIKKRRNKWPIILLQGLCAAILLYCRLAWVYDRADCVCSVLTYELVQHEIDDRVRAICDCNSSGTHLLVQMTCEHGVLIQLQVFPDNGFYWGKRLRGDN